MTSLVDWFLFIVVVVGFSITLWGIGQLLERLTCLVFKRQPTKATSPLSGVENVSIDFQSGDAIVGFHHISNCEDIASSCIEGVSSCLEGLHH